MNLSKLCDDLALRPTCIVGIDGRSGAGKTSVAALVTATLLEKGRTDVVTIEVEDFIPGWSGLVNGIEGFANDVVGPIRENGFAVARGWDWHRQQWSEPARVPSAGRAGIVLVTGCGSTSAHVAPFVDLSIWVDAPEEVRRSRIADRDSYDWSEHWEEWARQEDALLAERDSPALAHVRLETA